MWLLLTFAVYLGYLEATKQVVCEINEVFPVLGVDSPHLFVVNEITYMDFVEDNLDPRVS